MTSCGPTVTSGHGSVDGFLGSLPQQQTSFIGLQVELLLLSNGLDDAHFFPAFKVAPNK